MLGAAVAYRQSRPELGRLKISAQVPMRMGPYRLTGRAVMQPRTEWERIFGEGDRSRWCSRSVAGFICWCPPSGPKRGQSTVWSDYGWCRYPSIRSWIPARQMLDASAPLLRSTESIVRLRSSRTMSNIAPAGWVEGGSYEPDRCRAEVPSPMTTAQVFAMTLLIRRGVEATSLQIHR